MIDQIATVVTALLLGVEGREVVVGLELCQHALGVLGPARAPQHQCGVGDRERVQQFQHAGPQRVASYRADQGAVYVENPNGIGMVHQHFSLVEALTVWENVALGDNSRLDRSRTRDRVAELSHEYGLDVNPDDRVEDLPVGMRQRVELLKCLRRDPSVLILDEPTSVLTPEESEQLFDSLRKVVGEENRAVALVSHRLSEILHATDRITIMRNGAVIDRCLTKDTDANSLARSMVGREVGLSYSGLDNSSKDSDVKVKSEPDNESEKIKERFLLELQEITTSSALGV